MYKDYPAGYFPDINASYPNIDVNYTWGNGASGTWKMIEEEYHAPDETNPNGYWTFTMPELPEGSDWLNFYVEVSVDLVDCSEDNHGDGRGFEWTGAKEATCGEPGYTGDYKCKWCNYVKERGHDTPPTGQHGELIAEPDYMGDCDHAGYTGAKRCSVCDEIVVPREYHGKTHKVTKVEGTYIAVTCTSKGQTSQYVCGRCGIVLTRSKSTAKLPHDWECFEGTATCTTAGTLDYVKCKSCGQISIDGGETILRNVAKLNSGALGHSYSSTYTTDKKATTSAAGSKSRHCTRSGCTAKSSETVIPKISTVKLSTVNYTYNGSAKKPSVTVKDSKGTTLKNGTDYTVSYASGRTKIGKYKVTVTFKGNYSGSKDLYFEIGPKNPSTVKTVLYGYDDVKVSWSKVSGVTGYKVYYKKSTASGWTLLKTTTSTSYKKANLADGVKYDFKVVAYKTVSGNACENAGKTSGIYTLKKVAGVKAAKSGSKVKVKWTNISGETGYQISKSTSKTGTNIVATYKTTSGTYKTVSATKGKTYYYKVRAYKVVDGKKIYGPWSSVVKYKR